MKSLHLSVALGLGFTLAMSAVAAGFLGASEYIHVAVVAKALEALGALAVIALLPGSPIGMLSLNMHSTAYIVLTVAGDVVFYSFVANRVITRRARSRSKVEAKQ